VLTHGFTVDADGRKMSKSLGNTVEPQKVIDQMGADVLRLWIASTDYRNEMSVSDEILKRTGDVYRRIRNTARFLLGNLHGFDPAQDPRAAGCDGRAGSLGRASRLRGAEKITEAYARYDFAEIVQALGNFCSVDLGALYLDVTKDRLYTLARGFAGAPFRAVGDVPHRRGLRALDRADPAFTADEMWQHLPGHREGNVLFATWYDGLAPLGDDAVLSVQDMDRLLRAARRQSPRLLEPMRANGAIGAALEAEIGLRCGPCPDQQWLAPSSTNCASC
jgi:isoleucyl-tRNA synthetase